MAIHLQQRLRRSGVAQSVTPFLDFCLMLHHVDRAGPLMWSMSANPISSSQRRISF
jgi:hypothetical protein